MRPPNKHISPYTAFIQASTLPVEGFKLTFSLRYGGLTERLSADGASLSTQERRRTSWTIPMERAMLEGLTAAVQEGLNSDNGNFKAQGWAKAVAAVNEVSGRQVVSRDKCDNRWRKFKQVWRLWTKHKNQISGWTWDEGKETFINNLEVMDTYFYSHPEMVIFRERGPAHQILLEDPLNSRLVTGEFARGFRSFVRQLNSLEIPVDEVSLHQSIESPSPMRETSQSESLSPIIARKRSATMLIESQTPKQQQRQQKGRTTILAESINDFGQQMIHSSSQMSENFKSASQQAM